MDILIPVSTSDPQLVFQVGYSARVRPPDMDVVLWPPVHLTALT
jgi:hypothetical protein